MLDAIIIFATFALVIVDIELDDASLSGVNRARGVFRLFRIFLVMRKVDRDKKYSCCRQTRFHELQKQRSVPRG
mgnify:FL=1